MPGAAEVGAVRDLVLAKSLERLAAAAAERLRELTERGEEIPFEVVGPGEGSPFAQYTPMTGRFVRDHAETVTDLEPFDEACAALAESSLAAAYLEQIDEPVPEDEAERARAAAVAFLARLWEGSSEFPLEGSRIAAAVAELEGCAAGEETGSQLVAPLIGFHMPTTRLALGEATIVRADVVDVPDEVRRPEGTRRSPWEPQFLAVVRGADPPPDGAPLERGEASAPGAALRRLITALRLFKPGGVSLGPYAWAHASGDRWRRLPTGAGRPRPGGYRLADTELGDLADLCRALHGHNPPTRAIARFEAGLERPDPLDALSDYLLCLRYLLEGGGAADVGLPMRVAALRAEAPERAALKSRLERALALERALVGGEAPSCVEDRREALRAVALIEQDARVILREAACGRLGTDARAAADEALVAEGLAAGEGAAALRGATAEWGAVTPGEGAEMATTPKEEAEMGEAEMQEIESEQPTRVMVATKLDTEIALEPEIRVTRTAAPDRDVAERAEAESKAEPAQPEPEPEHADDWLSEVDSRGDTLDWPQRPDALRLLDRRPAEREAARRRVRHLFPRPEATDWPVAELQYDRSRARSRVS